MPYPSKDLKDGALSPHTGQLPATLFPSATWQKPLLNTSPSDNVR